MILIWTRNEGVKMKSEGANNEGAKSDYEMKDPNPPRDKRNPEKLKIKIHKYT